MIWVAGLFCQCNSGRLARSVYLKRFICKLGLSNSIFLHCWCLIRRKTSKKTQTIHWNNLIRFSNWCFCILCRAVVLHSTYFIKQNRMLTIHFKNNKHGYFLCLFSWNISKYLDWARYCGSFLLIWQFHTRGSLLCPKRLTAKGSYCLRKRKAFL